MEIKVHHQGWAQQKPILLCSEGRRRLCSSVRGKHQLCAPWRERIAWGFTAFFLALSCSPLAAAHPKTWQPPKGAGHTGSPNTYVFAMGQRPVPALLFRSKWTSVLLATTGPIFLTRYYSPAGPVFHVRRQKELGVALTLSLPEDLRI